jgi:hypothetical protein
MDPTYPHTTCPHATYQHSAYTNYPTSTIHPTNIQHAQEHLVNALEERVIQEDRAASKEYNKAVAADSMMPTGTRIKGAVGTVVDWASEKTHGMKAKKEERKARKHL